jgi:TetR/AcrR family transcriptional regulator
MARKALSTRKNSNLIAQADATRDRLLRAAELEFASKGLTGGRVDVIAGRARINKQLIYYHFGDKNSLYQAVLERAYAGIREKELALNLSGDAPIAAMQKLVGFTFDYCVENRGFVRLLVNENVLEGKFIRRSKAIRQSSSPLLQVLRDTVQRGVELGAFRKDVDPVQLYITIASLCFFYVSNIYTLGALFDLDLERPAALRERRRHVTDVVLCYLGADRAPQEASQRRPVPNFRPRSAAPLLTRAR